MAEKGKPNVMLLVLIVILAGIGVAVWMNREPEPQTAGEKLGAAVDEIGKGFERAGEKMQGEQTTGEKIGDAIENTGESIKETFDKQ